MNTLASVAAIIAVSGLSGWLWCFVFGKYKAANYFVAVALISIWICGELSQLPPPLPPPAKPTKFY